MPTVIFLDASGSDVLGQFSGYLPAEEYWQEMQQALDFVKLQEQYEKNPEDVQLNLKLALAYLERAMLEKAQPMAQRVLKADPDNTLGHAVQIHHSLARANAVDGNFEQAEEHLKKVRLWDEEGKHLPQLNFELGYQYLNQNQPDKAVSYLQKVYQEYTESEMADPARFFTGLAYALQERYEEALPLMRDYAENGKNERLRDYAKGQIKTLEEKTR